VDVLIADLDEDRAGLDQQVAGNGQAVAQVGEVEWMPSRQVSR